MDGLVRAQMWRRIQAFMFDYLLILGYLAVLATAGLLLTLGPMGSEWSALVSTPWRMDLLAFFTTVLPVIAYFTWSERSADGATWGKKRVGLRVVGLDGRRLGWGRALARSVAKFLPWQMAHTALLHTIASADPPAWTVWVLGAMWVLVAAYLVGLTQFGGGRTIYDRLSASQVVEARD